jgi:hypothetical protein
MTEQASRQYLCSGCPAEKVAQSISRHTELGPSDNGTILFGVLSSKKSAPVANAIKNGAGTVDEVITFMDREGSPWSPNFRPDEIQGDLTKSEVTIAAIQCMLRLTNGQCTLKDD